jgi:hypothetical protein
MDSNSRHQTLKRLQTGLARGAPFDLSTLARVGVSPPLAARYALPDWFTSRFPARYVYARLFDWPDEMLAAKTVVTPAGLPDGLHVSASERAVMELLYDVGTRQSLEEARNLFDGLRSPRKELMGQLLASCTNVKTVRLFLTWARESGLLDVDDLRARYPLRTGSDKRWMSRMPDGTLLTLKPHG